MPTRFASRRVILIVCCVLLLAGLIGIWLAKRQTVSSSDVADKPIDFTIPSDLSTRKLLAKDFDLSSSDADKAKVTARIAETFSKIDNEIKTAAALDPLLDIAVAYRDLASGVYHGINDLEVMPTGSLVKVAVMIATLKKIEAQPALSRVLITYDASKLPTVRVWDLPFFHPAPEREIYDQHVYTLDQLLFKMAALSSNKTAALLFDFVKPEFDALYTNIGIKPPSLELPSRDAKDSLTAFEVLFRASYLNEASSRKALYILTRSDFNVGLQARLPGDLQIAHKFGTNLDDRGTYWLHECGIVYTPRPYDICVFTRGENLYVMRDLIQEISKTIYDGQVAH